MITTQPKINITVTQKYTETWAAMEKLVETGKVRDIGTLQRIF